MSGGIGVYGGTFNPVHCGHVRLGLAFRDALELDRLLVIPANDPPHKIVPHLAAGIHRLKMCRLAFGDRAQVLDMELKRGGRSYTVDTLTELRASYPQQTLYLLMGSDMFLTLQQWERWEEILKLAVLCVAARKPQEEQDLRTQQRVLEQLGAKCVFLPLPPMELSSTDIRTMLMEGITPPPNLIPKQVLWYIQTQGLYPQQRKP